jgi:hypothetical protein
MDSPHRDEWPDINWSERLKTLVDPRQYPLTKALLILLVILTATVGIYADPLVLLFVLFWLGGLFFAKESSANLTGLRTATLEGLREGRENYREAKRKIQALSYRQTAIKGALQGLTYFALAAAVVVVLFLLSKPDFTKLAMTAKEAIATAAIVAGFAGIMALGGALVSASWLAAVRKEYSLLALPYLAIIGAIAGAIMGPACFFIWHWLWLNDLGGMAAIWPPLRTWLLVSAGIGALGNAWWRLIGGVGNLIDFLANATMRGKVLVIGLFWMAAAVTLFIVGRNLDSDSFGPDGRTVYWAIVVIGFFIGVFWFLGRGLGPARNALKGPAKLTKDDLRLGGADIAAKDEAARAARGDRQ